MFYWTKRQVINYLHQNKNSKTGRSITLPSNFKKFRLSDDILWNNEYLPKKRMSEISLSKSTFEELSMERLSKIRMKDYLFFYLVDSMWYI